MPKPSFRANRPLARCSAILSLIASLTAAAALLMPAAASASRGQIAIMQDGQVLEANPAWAMAKFRSLGATTVRVLVFWHDVAPNADGSKKPTFDATNPSAYSADAWKPFDDIDRIAQQDGMTVDFDITGGAPLWADGPGMPSNYRARAEFQTWKPNATDYGQFVQAVATRYGGTFTPAGDSAPLPAVHFWSLWNEPNFGQDLGPEATNGSRTLYAPMMYRNLINAGYSALRRTGHGHDTILWGEFAARGSLHTPTRLWPQGLPGNGGQMKPLMFIRTLYCLDGSYRELRGAAAKSVGCPTSASASRSFRTKNPVLFNASGVSDHPYPGNGSPLTDGKTDPDFAAFPDLGNLASTLDRANRVYGSRKRYPLYNDEYGYITDPPNTGPVASSRGHYASPATAAIWINWAEYLSWKNPRVASYSQYLLNDPPSGGPVQPFASGLYFYNGKPKPVLNAYELPVWMPNTRHGNLEVWGEARPARFAGMDTHLPQHVAIQFQAHGHGAYKNVKLVSTAGYFDVHVRFPSAGNVRLAYQYPAADDFLSPIGVQGKVILSRTVKIS